MYPLVPSLPRPFLTWGALNLELAREPAGQTPFSAVQ